MARKRHAKKKKNLQGAEIGPTSQKSKAWYLSPSACIPDLLSPYISHLISLHQNIVYLKEEEKKEMKEDAHSTHSWDSFQP